MWNREPRYLRLSGQALLDYAHSRGVWLTDANFSPEHNRDLVEKGCAAKLGDAEIRSRIRARQTEIYSQRATWAAIVAAVAALLGIIPAWILVIWK
jgi:hypothetical protein